MFTPIADAYKEVPEFGCLVLSTTRPWDVYSLPFFKEVGKLKRATKTSDMVIRFHCYEDTIGMHGFRILVTPMLWQMTVSHIPFNNPKLINVPAVLVATKLVIFRKSSAAGNFYNNLVDGSYKGHRVRNTGVASMQAIIQGKTPPFGPHWLLIHLISVLLILSPTLLNLGISSAEQLWMECSGVPDFGRLNLIMLRRVIPDFPKAFAGKTDWTSLPGRSVVSYMIRSWLHCPLELSCWLGLNNISVTPWQQKTMERT